MHTQVHSTIVRSQELKGGSSPTIHQRMNEHTMCYIGVYNGVLFALRREKILTHTTMWMNLEDIMLTEIASHRTNTQILCDSAEMR